MEREQGLPRCPGPNRIPWNLHSSPDREEEIQGACGAISWPWVEIYLYTYASTNLSFHQYTCRQFTSVPWLQFQDLARNSSTLTTPRITHYTMWRSSKSCGAKTRTTKTSKIWWNWSRRIKRGLKILWSLSGYVHAWLRTSHLPELFHHNWIKNAMFLFAAVRFENEWRQMWLVQYRQDTV